MEKTIEINGKPIKFKSTGAFLIKYKSLTGEDPIKALSKLENMSDIENVDLTTLYKLVWALAKTADDSIGDMEQWYDSFEFFPIGDVVLELQDFLTKSFISNISLKKDIKKNQIPKN